MVLKLQTECQKLNDEQVSKLAVMLLNCQSAIEGRPIYQCTEYMVSTTKALWNINFLIFFFCYCYDRA